MQSQMQIHCVCVEDRFEGLMEHDIVHRRQVYQQLRSIYPSLACRQFLDGLQQLEKECGYGEERIPQLREVSAFLKGVTEKNRKYCSSCLKFIRSKVAITYLSLGP